MQLGKALSWITLILIIIALSSCNTPPLSPTNRPPTSTPTKSPTPPSTPTLAPTATSTVTPSATPTPAVSPTTALSMTPTEIITPTATATAVPTADDTVPIGELNANSGDGIMIKGQIIATASFSKGFKFTVDDGTGQLVLLLWHPIYDESAAAPQLNLGATVRVTGRIGSYEGELQIEPYEGSDVQVLSGGYQAAAVSAGAVGERLGERVTVTGQVSRVEGAGKAVKVYVADESGEVLVFIWNNILERIPNANPALGTVGSRVRVTGEVTEYKGTLEIVPTLPYDVEILQ